MTKTMPRASQTTCPCGFKSKVTTEGLAAHALAKHSCERQRILQARAAAVAARLADPGVARECTHKIARHEHGTHAAYVLDRCRCRPCREANAAYEGRRAKETAYGRWKPYVDAGPARRHIKTLAKQGLGPKRVAVLSGVPHGSLAKLVYGDPQRGLKPSKRIRPETAAKILAVQATVESLGSTVAVDATDTHRRLQHLVVAGWSQSELARRLGMMPSNFTGTMRGPRVRAATARAVIALFEQLHDQPPPTATPRERAYVARARAYAAAHGWTSYELVAPTRGKRPADVETSSELVRSARPIEEQMRREQILRRMVCELCGRDGLSKDFPCTKDGRVFWRHEFVLQPLRAAS